MMLTTNLAVVVLAAGLGKRFKSQTPKVLHRAAGRPLIHYVMRSVEGLGAERVIVVVGHGKDEVVSTVSAEWPAVTFVEQPELLGTADAVRRCEGSLEGFTGTVLVTNGDTPLVRPPSLREFVDQHDETGAHASLMVALLDDPTGYGRIVRGDSGEFERVVEEADVTPQQKSIREVSTGIWCFEPRALFEALSQVGAENAQGEYYLPDVAWVIASKGGIIRAVMATDRDEVGGVNDRVQLAEAARELRVRVLEKLMASGVTIEDPANAYIDEGVEVGPETVIRPNTYLEGATRIGSGCTIGPATRIVDSTVEDGTEITFSVVLQSRIGPGCQVGPYAYLRPDTRLERGAKAGTFVEMKNAQIGEGTKVPHLSYVGDAEVGRDANLGAGTITGNYDGETGVKSKTVIGDEALTGSGTTLVAPVEMGKGSVTGAGAVVTHDVGPEDVVVGIPARPVRKRKPRPRENRDVDDS